MFTYTYPLVSGGYIWNMLQRIIYSVGIAAAYTNNVEVLVYPPPTPENPFPPAQKEWRTQVIFNVELTTTQKAALDALMADNPTYPPTTGQGAVIRDLWEEFEWFKQQAGLPNLRLFYTEGTAGSGKIDRMFLWHPTPITGSQKNALRTAYNNLWIG